MLKISSFGLGYVFRFLPFGGAAVMSEMCTEGSICVSAIFYMIDFRVFVWVCRESTARGFHFKLNIRLEAEVKTSANQSTGYSQIGLLQSDSQGYLNISLQHMNCSQQILEANCKLSQYRKSCWRGVMNKDALKKNEEAAGLEGRDEEEVKQQW